MMSFSAPSMDREMITLNPGIQIGKDKYHVLSPIDGKEKNHTNKVMYPTKCFTDLEKQLTNQNSNLGWAARRKSEIRINRILLISQTKKKKKEPS